MSTVRIALANVEFPATPEESIRLAEDAIAQASTAGADIICFPECFVPGYRGMAKQVAPPDAEFLERAWSLTAKAAAKGNIAVVLGTERVVNDGLRISVLTRTSLRPMQTRRIRFTKRRRCAAPRRTPAFSQPSTVQAEGRARRPLSCGLMELS